MQHCILPLKHFPSFTDKIILSREWSGNNQVMVLFPGDPVPQHFVSPNTDLDIKLLLKYLGLTRSLEITDTEQLCFGGELGNPTKGGLGEVSGGAEYGPHIPKIQIHQHGFIGKGFPSSSQPQQWRCLIVTLLCLLGDSENFLWEFPSHLRALQLSKLRVPGSSGSQTHLKSQVWNNFLYLNLFQRNRFWLRGFIHHLPAPAKLNEPNLSRGGIQSWIPKSRTQWESSGAELEPHSVGRLTGVSGLL